MDLKGIMGQLADALGIEDKGPNETMAEYVLGAIQKNVIQGLHQVIHTGMQLTGLPPFGLFEHPTDPYTLFVGMHDGTAVQISIKAVSKSEMEGFLEEVKKSE